MFTLFTNLNNDNTVSVTQQLLHTLRIPFSSTDVKEAIKQNSNYPSIAVVYNVMKQYKTETIVLQIDKSKSQQTPVSFDAHLLQKPLGFVTVTNVSSNELTRPLPKLY